MMLTLRMSRDRAVELGLLVCKHCGWPKNNHFITPPHLSANDKSCPGYKEGGLHGIEIVAQGGK